MRGGKVSQASDRYRESPIADEVKIPREGGNPEHGEYGGEVTSASRVQIDDLEARPAEEKG